MKIIPLKIVIAALALWGIGTAIGLAGEKVSAALYLGENSKPDEDDTVAPEKLSQRLHEIFGYKYYKQIKVEEVDLKRHWEQWVLPRKDFFMLLKPVAGKADGPPHLYYEVYQNGFIVAHGTYQPSDGTPLFFNGPYLKRGQLLFVLEPK